MTEKQRRFVQEYLIDLNATQSAIRAGYSPKRAAEIGHQLLQKTTVLNAIKEEQEKREKRVGISQDYVLNNLVEVIERSMQRAPVCDSRGNHVEDEEGRNIWQFDGKNANKGLELLGRHLGLFQGNGTGRPDSHKKILERYRNGEISLKDAALEFEINNLPLPETIRIMLGKEQLEPEDTSKGQYCLISDEEMEIRVSRRMTEINAQRENLPERQKEIRKLHNMVQDKFAPQRNKISDAGNLENSPDE